MTGCAKLNKGCDIDGQAVAIIDMTWRSDTKNERMQQMARTMAHEFGHLVNFGNLLEAI